MNASETSGASDPVSAERETADAVTRREHVEADAAVSLERTQQHRALLQLLASEREETDRVLAFERLTGDRRVAGRDELLAVVTHDLRGHLTRCS